MAKSKEAATTFPAQQHDHARCIVEARSRAEAAFADQGLRLTPLRATVLEEIAASHRAQSAYDLLESLSRKGHRLAPISVYRALDALVEAGVVHRLESGNAFFACHSDHERGQESVVLACRGCGRVAEVPAGHVLETVTGMASDMGFRSESVIVEVRGMCAACDG
jgi:Fur family zinc uptake transcriptional regulator